MKTVWKTLEET